ncbi:MAG: ribosome maturation factor RimP [Magnetococcales bacterium]|nr:ribosome maturation factor RimP [Magnetococcales bacterium]
MSNLLEELTSLSRQAARAAGCELVDLHYVKDGRSWFLRLFIERLGGASPTIEDCARVSDHVEGLLDVRDPLPHAYRLEVSSPGLERPLKTREDFIRFQGRAVRLTTLLPLAVGGDDGAARQRHFKGVIQEVVEQEVVLTVREGERLAIPLAAIGKANLELEIKTSGQK